MGSEIGDIWKLERSPGKSIHSRLVVNIEYVEKTKPGMREHWWEQDTLPRVKTFAWERQNIGVPEPSTVVFWTRIYLTILWKMCLSIWVKTFESPGHGLLTVKSYGLPSPAFCVPIFQSKHLVNSGGLLTEKVGKQEKLHWGLIQTQTTSKSTEKGLRVH